MIATYWTTLEFTTGVSIRDLCPVRLSYDRKVVMLRIRVEHRAGQLSRASDDAERGGALGPRHTTST